MIVSCGARAAAAQTAGLAELTGTFVNSSVPGEFARSRHAGWLVSTGISVTPSMNIVVEGSGTYRTDQLGGTYTDHVVALGPKFTYPSTAHPYAQILAGLIVHRMEFGIGGPRSTVTQRSFLLQPGVGVDVSVAAHLAIRVAGDWMVARPQYSAAWWPAYLRLGVGLTYRMVRN